MQHHILSFGMGVESSALLLHWLLNPSSRPFANWQDCTIITAQTGNEFPSTKLLVETHLLPLLRDRQVRWVQVAKAGEYQKHGYKVLSDTTEPYECLAAGDYALGENLLGDGVSIRLETPHYCAMKWKGYPIDSWISANFPSGNVQQYLGYNCDEQRRVKTANEYGKGKFLYPLFDWQWSRQDCLNYLHRHFNVWWEKSCCTFCPFQRPESALQRYKADPQSGAYVLQIQHQTLVLNPKINLFAAGYALDLLEQAGCIEAIALHQQWLASSRYCIYHLRRMYHQAASGRVMAKRSVRVVFEEGSYDRAVAQLQQIAIHHPHAPPITYDRGIPRLQVHIRIPKIYPACEEFYAVGPAGIRDKCPYSNYDDLWEQTLADCQPTAIPIPIGGHNPMLYKNPTFQDLILHNLEGISEHDYLQCKAIAGIQAGRPIFSLMLHFPDLAWFDRRLADDRELPPQMRSQRTLNPKRAKNLKLYIEKNSDSYVLPAISMSIADGQEQLRFLPLDPDLELGILLFPNTAVAYIFDGQHRHHSILELIKEEAFQGESVPVTLYLDRGLEWRQQAFADLNNTKTSPEKSLALCYDQRNATAIIAKAVLEALPHLETLTDMERTTLPKTSSQIFTLKWWVQACDRLLAKNTTTLDEKRALAIAWWSAVDKVMLWHKAQTFEIAPAVMRQELLCANAIALGAFGRLGNLIAQQNYDLTPLKSINWRKQDRLWLNVAINPNTGRIVTGGKGEQAMCDRLYQLLM